MGNDKTSKELRNEKSRARYAKMDVRKKEKLLALARDKYRQRSMHMDVFNKKKSLPMEVTDPSAIACSSNSTVSSSASLSRNSVHFASMGCTESVISNNGECFVQETSESFHMPSICLPPDASPPLVLRRSSRLVTGQPSFLQSKPYDHVQRRTIRNEKDRTRYAAMDAVAQKDLLCRNRAHSALITDQPMTFSQVSYAGPPVALSSEPHNRFDNLKRLPLTKWMLRPEPLCKYCGAFRFSRETSGFCCGGGQVWLAKTVPCPILWFLFTDAVSEVACEFRRRVRSYNNAFAFTSIGMSFDPKSWWAREGIYALKVFGQVSHYVNPIDGNPNKASLLQLFFLDAVDQLDADLLERKDMRPDVMALLIEALANNPYTKFFKRLRSWDNLAHAHIVIKTSPSLDQRNCNVPTVDEVAGVWKDGDGKNSGSERDIRVYTDGGRSLRMNYYYSCYDPTQYPVLFPHGEPGWHAGIQKISPHDNRDAVHVNEVIPTVATAKSADEVLAAEEEGLQQNRKARNNVSCREYYCYKAQIRRHDSSYLLHSGRLGHQFIIDMYIKLESSRLDYYKSEQFQKEVRTESYQGIIDSLLMDGQADPSQIGQKIILPSSFIGGPRDMRRRYINAMALVQRYGKPDLFLTMTCNPKWKEIQDNLLPSEKPHDRPDLLARVFKAKLDELKDDIFRKKIFGDVAAYVYVIEYQKRGLPHVHWLIILAAHHKIVSPNMYDHLISAELPDSSHPLLREYVVRHMMHGPCGKAKKKNVCMRDGQCKDHYPKEFEAVTCNGANSYPRYRRRYDGRSVMVQNVRLDNRDVIPHCPYLLVKFDCHMNLEVCTDIKLVKYMYKYIYKGHDKMAYNIVGRTALNKFDEIQSYQEGRYICAPEAYWRIFAFPMSETYPAVIVIPVHLENHQPLRFGIQPPLGQILINPLDRKTMLTEFFVMNTSDADAKRLNLTYKDFPEHFVWEPQKHKWKLRQKQIVIGRLCAVSPLEGERYFERLLLGNVRCPTSFEDLMSFEGIKYTTFREAAVRRGLLQSDEYMDACLNEAASFQMPYSLRVLFAMLLVYGIAADPQVLWDKYYPFMCEDFLQQGFIPGHEVFTKTVDAIELVLTSMDKSLLDFPIRFAFPYSFVKGRMSRDYDHERSMTVSIEDSKLVNSLNEQQRTAYNAIIHNIIQKKPGVYFIDGPGGTGKTYLYRALLAYVRSQGEIALAVASSGVAASLLPGGRTAHSRFKLPVDVEDKNIGKISKQSSLARMVKESSLIIWDEASMANRHSIEALDKLLQDLCDNKSDFGGKIVLFGGDFRQTLPIILHGTREDTIGASIVSSKIWKNVIRLRLTENMRAKEDPNFIYFLLRLGNGEIPFIFDDNIEIPQCMLIPFVDTVTSLNHLIESVYPSLDAFLTDPYSFINRGILTPKNDCVGEINDLLMERFPGEVKEYVSFNRTNDSAQQVEYEDYLSSISTSGLPPHILRLKKNCPIMLLRNINPVQGLCNGTRLICRELGDNFIKAEIAAGDFKGNIVFIPRIPLEASDKLKCPIPFKRMQIPVRPCFAMTINKAQGQTFDVVGIYLREPVFSHGQLYVALSRARCSGAVKILLHPDLKTVEPIDYTKNIVYPEIFALSEARL